MNKPASIEMHRTIQARVQRVYEAWTTPELICRWLAPGLWLVTRARVDLSIGGGFEIGMRSPSDTEETGVLTGTYESIIPNKLLIFSWRWSQDPSQHTRVTVVLSETDSGVELALKHEFFATETARRKHEAGWRDNLVKLDLLLAAEQVK